MDWLKLYDKFQDRRTMNIVNSCLTVLCILGFLILAMVLKTGLNQVYEETKRIEPTVIHDTITIKVVQKEPKRCFICKSPLTFNSDSLATCCDIGYFTRKGEVYRLESE